MPTIKFKKDHPDAIIPQTWSDQAIGFDIHALLISDQGRPNTLIVPPNFTRMIPTGLLIETPPGYYACVFSRSGLASRSVFVANAPGLVDPDYRGEVKVLIFNGGHENFFVRHHDRVGQLVLVPMVRDVKCEEVETLSSTDRGDSGFGSTGKGTRS